MGYRRETARDVILYEYAKLIADAAVANRAPDDKQAKQRYWAFVTATHGRLLRRAIRPSSILRENKLMVAASGRCAYCGETGELHWEHIVPLAAGGPDNIDNLVQACPPCNLQKGGRDPLQWLGGSSKHVPRLVLGKLLKLAFETHEQAGTLDVSVAAEGARPRLIEVLTVFERVT